MAKIRLGQQSVAKPFLVRIYGVTCEEFVEWHAGEASLEWLDGQVVLESPWDECAISLVNWLYELIHGVCRQSENFQVLSPRSMLSLRGGQQFLPAISVKRSVSQASEAAGQRADCGRADAL